MAHDVFISYSSKDKPQADAVCARLEQDGIRCWIAPRDVLPGREWGEEIINGLQGARVVVLVFSGHANSSKHVRHEIERAVDKEIAILPFRIEDVRPSGSMELYLYSQHWLDAMTPPLEAHLKTLSASVQRLLGGAAVIPKESPPSDHSVELPRATANWIRWASAALLLGLLFVTGYFAYKRWLTKESPAVGATTPASQPAASPVNAPASSQFAAFMQQYHQAYDAGQKEMAHRALQRAAVEATTPAQRIEVAGDFIAVNDFVESRRLITIVISALASAVSPADRKDYAQAFLVRGLGSLYQGEDSEAESDFSHAIEANPDLGEAYCFRAQALMKLPDRWGWRLTHSFAWREGRVAAEERAFRNDKKGSTDSAVLAAHLFSEYPRACADVERALQRKPDFANAHFLRGVLHLWVDEYRQAIEQFNEANKLGYSGPGSYICLSAVYYRMGNLDVSDKAIDEAARRWPKSAYAHLLRAMTHLREPDVIGTTAAEDELTLAISLQADFSPAFELRARLYQGLRQPGRAEADMEAFRRLDPPDGYELYRPGDRNAP